jgi:hypothetical protein
MGGSTPPESRRGIVHFPFSIIILIHVILLMPLVANEGYIGFVIPGFSLLNGY